MVQGFYSSWRERGGTSMGLMVGVLVLAAFVSGVSYFAWRQRKQKAALPPPRPSDIVQFARNLKTSWRLLEHAKYVGGFGAFNGTPVHYVAWIAENGYPAVAVDIVLPVHPYQVFHLELDNGGTVISPHIPVGLSRSRENAVFEVNRVVAGIRLHP